MNSLAARRPKGSLPAPPMSNQLPLLNRVAMFVCLACLLVGCARQVGMVDRRVLVFDFDTAATAAVPAAPNATPGAVAPQLGASLADLMTASLANYPRVGVVDRQGVRPLLDQARREPTRLQEFGQEIGVDYIIVGSVARLDQNYVLNARLLSMSTGEVVKGSSVTRSCRREQDLYPVIEAMTRVLAGHVRVLAERYDELQR